MATSGQTSADGLAVEIPAEHLVSPTLRRALQQCYERGKTMAAKDPPDHDYATTMFSECVVKDPSNLVYIEAFLDNLQAKYKNNKKGARTLGFGGGGRKGEFKKALAAKNWNLILKIGPELLKTNPWDVATLRAMAQACEAFRYNEVELRYLKNALDANPKDVDVNRHCAVSLARMGQFDQAIACWHRIEELKPTDPDASKMVAELSIEKTRVRTMGLQPTARRAAAPTASAAAAPPGSTPAAPGAAATSSTGAAAEAPEPATAPRKREIQLTPVQRLEKAIATDPTLLENYLELAELYMDEHKFADAERVLHRGQQAAPGALDLLEKADELRIRQAKHQLKIAEKRAAAEDTAAARELIEQLRQNLLRVELDAAHTRADRYPQDLEAKFTLATVLKKLGNYRQAAEQFQAARESPERRLVATLELGECLQHLKQYVKALHCYQRTAEKAPPDQEPELHKLALYRAGVLAMGLKDWEAASQALGSLVALAPDFRDAAGRLDKVRTMSDKG